MSEEYKDRTAGLIVFGVLEILGGLMCMLLAAVSLLPLVITPEAGSMPQILPGMMVYVFLAVWLVWMGIGTIRARRWARVLMLAASWLALVCGMVAMGMMLYMLPKIYATMNLPDAAASVAMTVTYTSLAIFYLLIPAVGIMFHGNRNVRATIEQADVHPSWAERCPLPVLILSMLLMLTAPSMLLMGCMNFAMPFYGAILSGWQGAMVQMSVSIICIVLAIGIYRLRLFAWWAVLALLSLGLASQLLTFGQVDLMDLYRAMGYSDQFLQQMQGMAWLDDAMLGTMSLVYAVPGFIYLLMLKCYFKNKTGEN